MKILAINGSPRGNASSSREIISKLEKYTEGRATIHLAASRSDTFTEALLDHDVWVIAFPLYVDGLPASLMRFLLDAEAALQKRKRNGSLPIRVFAVCNCGFYEGEQNAIALKIVQHFCVANGLQWCGGVGIGTGEMIRGNKNIPDQAGIKRPVVDALKMLTEAMLEADGRMTTLFTQHKFPRFLYMKAGQHGMRKQARNNGVTRRALHARPLGE